MINVRLHEIQDETLLELLAEIETVSGVASASYSTGTLLDYLMVAQRDMITEKRKAMDASRFYIGSLLKTKISKLQDSGVRDLAIALCRHFRVNFAFVEGKTMYVFLNEILNRKSKLRKPLPFRL